MAAVNFSKKGRYDYLNRENQEPLLQKVTVSTTSKKFYGKDHYIHKSDNPDDAIIKNAVEPIVMPVSQDMIEKNKLLGISTETQITIPPALSGLSFKSKDKAESFQTPFEVLSNLPESWVNYKRPNEIVDASEKDGLGRPFAKYLLTTRPQNQHNCGSCFAFSVAGAINDVFVMSDLTSLNFNPNIGPMSILSCIQISDNSQCDGGNPMEVLKYISQYGVLTSHCINYDELLYKKVFTPPPIQSTDTEKTTIDVNSYGLIQYNTTTSSPPNWTYTNYNMNTLEKTVKTNLTNEFPKKFIKNNVTDFYVPFVKENSQCKCVTNKSNATSTTDPHYKYKINNPVNVVVDEYPNAVNIIKSHLYRHGAAVSSIFLMKNFQLPETFEETRGIYIESEPYKALKSIVNVYSSNGSFLRTDKTYEAIPDPYTQLGGHAIVVVGWGVDKNPITLSNGVRLNEIPYWICRNSWSESWGDSGYFKIAMYQKTNNMVNGKYYEVNPMSCIEKYKDYNDGGTIYPNQGGVILFTPSTDYSLYNGEYVQMSPSQNKFSEKELSPSYTPQNLLLQSQYPQNQTQPQQIVQSSTPSNVNITKDQGYPVGERGRNSYTIPEKKYIDEKADKAKEYLGYLKDRKIQIALCIVVFVIILWLLFM
jgi:hypothetical protein